MTTKKPLEIKPYDLDKIKGNKVENCNGIFVAKKWIETWNFVEWWNDR